MYSLIYSIYFASYKVWKKSNSKLAWLIFRLSVFCGQRYFPNGYVKQLKKNPAYGLNKTQNRTVPIVASLTSYPGRIETIWITIETIFRQTEKADIIELWLASEQFPNGIADLPQELVEQMKRGLTIRFCDDLRSHKKYYYAMQEHPEAIVITFDDDFFYPLDTIKKMMELHKYVPKNVVGMANTCFSKVDFMNPISWKMQEHEARECINLGICSGAGTMFPPRVLSEAAFDKVKIKELSLKADDQWLTAMVYKNQWRISTVGRMPFPIEVPGTQEFALTRTNNCAEAPVNNDTQWEQVITFYKDDLTEWISKIE